MWKMNTDVWFFIVCFNEEILIVFFLMFEKKIFILIKEWMSQ